jgi:hypothetical protein
MKYDVLLHHESVQSSFTETVEQQQLVLLMRKKARSNHIIELSKEIFGLDVKDYL